jgi:hypothetical protein
LPPAAKTLFVKRVLDSQKLLFNRSKRLGTFISGAAKRLNGRVRRTPAQRLNGWVRRTPACFPDFPKFFIKKI